MSSDNKSYEIDYLIVDTQKKLTLDSDDIKDKNKITLDIVIKEVEDELQ